MNAILLIKYSFEYIVTGGAIMVDRGKGLSIAGLVLGIVATVLAWFYLINIIALASGIVGLVCAVLGRKRSAESGMPTGMGTAGLVMSIIGTALAGIGFFSCTVCVLCAVNNANTAINSLRYY